MLEALAANAGMESGLAFPPCMEAPAIPQHDRYQVLVDHVVQDDGGPSIPHAVTWWNV
jgi:hypothetical protein